MKQTAAGASRVYTDEILARLDEQVVEIDGRKMSFLEGTITLLYKRALEGDVSASIDLQKMRDRCEVEDPRKYGVLLVPEPLPEDEYEKAVAEQQAPFRDSSYTNDGV